MKMRNLLILTLIFFCSCNNAIVVSEKIEIETTKNNMDIVYQNLSAVVLKINEQRLREKIYAKYPGIIKDYIERIEIKSTKTTNILNTNIDNTKTNSEAYGICVEISMNYDKSKPEQAMLIIKDYKTLLVEEIIKHNISIKKE